MSVKWVGALRVRPYWRRSARVTPTVADALGGLPVAGAAVALYRSAGADRPRRILAAAAVLAVAAAAAPAWAARVAIRRALRTVGELHDELDRVWDAAPGRRVEVPATGDEVELLARRVNQLLDRLEKAAAHRRAFIADASHELRTPLTGLRTRIELAVAAPGEDDEATATLRDALHDVERLHGIVEDLLVLAQLDAGDVPPREQVDLGALAELETGRRAPSVPTNLKVEPGVLVRASAPRLARLLRNLLGNAERHAASRIEVQVRAEDGEAVLDVHDDGPGIPPADRERVFERFSRLDTARSRADGGSGLGLPVAREIALAYDGRLYVAGDAYGARLVLRLPLER